LEALLFDIAYYVLENDIEFMPGMLQEMEGFR